MGWLSKRMERAVERRDRHKVTDEDRLALTALATGLLGRDDDEESSFDADIHRALSLATPGSEGAALRHLVLLVQDREVTITLGELTAFGRCARAFGVGDDDWTFLAENVG